MDVRAESVTSAPEPVALDVSALWRQHYRTMVRLAFLLTGSQAHAEDLVQDAFVSCNGDATRSSIRWPTYAPV